MARLHLDLESYSEVDLTKVGVYVYAAHPSTEILCASWSIDDGPVRTLGYGEKLTPLYKDIRRIREVAAHNAQHERIMLRRFMPMTRRLKIDWVCTAAKAALHSLPRGLKKCCIELDTVEQKDETGKLTMMKLSKPRRPTKASSSTRFLPDEFPDMFDTLYEYCEQDVRCERSIDETLPDLMSWERELYQLDQTINDRGVQVDMKLVDLIISHWNSHLRKVNAECVKICGLTTTQTSALAEWLELESVAAPVVADALKTARGRRKRVMLLRQEGAKTSVKKFFAMKAAAGEDERLRGMFLYFGAGPGRWACRIVQLHNLPRNTSKDVGKTIKQIERGGITGDLAQQLIRPSLIAKADHELLVGDFSGVEYCITMWIVNCRRALDIIKSGLDLYKTTAQSIYAVSDYEAITDDQRFLGKQAVLGLGFGMGWPKFVEACARYGVEISDALAMRTVEIYRKDYNEVKQGWGEVEKAAIAAVKGAPGVKRYALKRKVFYVKLNRFLYCVLPSGRTIAYFSPEIRWDEQWQRDQLWYRGQNSVTTQWDWISTWGGKEFENIVQGIARDFLAHSMQNLEAEEMEVVLHVHDEPVAETPINRFTLQEFEAIMTRLPTWGGDFPMRVESFKTQRYRKG